MKKYYLGIDVGGTAVKIGIVDQEGNIAAKTEAPVNQDGYKTPVIETVLRTAEQFLAERPEKVLGVGGFAVSRPVELSEEDVRRLASEIVRMLGARICLAAGE